MQVQCACRQSLQNLLVHLYLLKREITFHVLLVLCRQKQLQRNYGKNLTPKLHQLRKNNKTSLLCNRIWVIHCSLNDSEQHTLHILCTLNTLKGACYLNLQPRSFCTIAQFFIFFLKNTDLEDMFQLQNSLFLHKFQIFLESFPYDARQLLFRLFTYLFSKFGDAFSPLFWPLTHVKMGGDTLICLEISFLLLTQTWQLIKTRQHPNNSLIFQYRERWFFKSYFKLLWCFYAYFYLIPVKYIGLLQLPKCLFQESFYYFLTPSFPFPLILQAV